MWVDSAKTGSGMCRKDISKRLGTVFFGSLLPLHVFQVVTTKWDFFIGCRYKHLHLQLEFGEADIEMWRNNRGALDSHTRTG